MHFLVIRDEIRERKGVLDDEKIARDRRGTRIGVEIAEEVLVRKKPRKILQIIDDGRK
jgi:hypothetical protein